MGPRETLGREETSHAFPNRTGLADGPETLDCAHPGDDADGAHGRHSGAATVHFTPAELTELNAAVQAIEIKGQRLPEQVQVMSGVEAPAKT